MRSILAILTLSLLVVSGAHAKALRPIIPPVRPDITSAPDARGTGIKYALPTFATKTVTSAMTSRAVASLVAPKGMPERDVLILADQIAVINRGKKVGGMFVPGTKLTVPVYRLNNGSRLAQADIRNWNYALYAGLRWGVSPALLLAVRNHENPKSSRDNFGLGVMHVKREGIWLQYEQGAYVIKALIANKQHWNPKYPTYDNVFRCGRSYAEGSCSWGPAVWAQYKRAIGA